MWELSEIRLFIPLGPSLLGCPMLAVPQLRGSAPLKAATTTGLPPSSSLPRTSSVLPDLEVIPLSSAFLLLDRVFVKRAFLQLS